MLKKDERVRLISEILNGIKLLKLYAWELSFVKRINSLREEEVGKVSMSHNFFCHWWSCQMSGLQGQEHAWPMGGAWKVFHCGRLRPYQKY